jgi:SAM-dependent methyltransferase
MIREELVAVAKSIAAKVLKRQLVFLPLGANGNMSIRSEINALLPLRYMYRASTNGIVTYQMQVSGSDLNYNLYTMTYPDGPSEKPQIGQLCLSCRTPSVTKGDELCVSLTEPHVWMNQSQVAPSFSSPSPARKFIAEVQLSSGHRRLTRTCSHYLPFQGKPIGRDYYFGDDYVDYPRQTNAANAVNTVRQYCSTGRLLDIGCALGFYTKGFLDAGFDAYGIDTSEFAIAEAGKRVGHDRVQQCTPDLSTIPFGPAFDIFWMQDVLEHTPDPKGMLEKITEIASPGSWLFLETSNSQSLTHRILEDDWEAYSDYSHHGVDRISATTLSGWLRNLGWTIVDWRCDSIWVEGADPVILRLREAFSTIPELSVLLSERNLGDLVRVVAQRLDPVSLA